MKEYRICMPLTVEEVSVFVCEHVCVLRVCVFVVGGRGLCVLV
jgi:hypothetical protein